MLCSVSGSSTITGCSGAGAATAEALAVYMRGTPISVRAIKATDLSGFCLEEDMSGCMVIAITQSGTTTDTNRAVSMARERGASLRGGFDRKGGDGTLELRLELGEGFRVGRC